MTEPRKSPGFELSDLRAENDRLSRELLRVKSVYNKLKTGSWKGLYDELLFAVETKYPGETRHQTALRYIKERENRLSQPEEAGDARGKIDRRSTPQEI